MTVEQTNMEPSLHKPIHNGHSYYLSWFTLTYHGRRLALRGLQTPESHYTYHGLHLPIMVEGLHYVAFKLPNHTAKDYRPMDTVIPIGYLNT